MPKSESRSHLNDAAVFTHRRSTVNVGNPALLLHRAYRLPAGEVDVYWRQAISDFAAKIHKKLRKVSTTATSLEPFSPESLEARRHCTFRTSLDAVVISISIDILDEIWTSKLVIDFSRYSGTPDLPEPFSSLFHALNDVEELIRWRVENSKIHEVNHMISLKRVGANTSADDRLKDIQASLIKVMGSVEKLIFPGETISVDSVACNSERHKFADFVGLSLSVPAYIEPDDQEQASLFEGPPQPRPKRKKFNNVFDNIHADLRIPEKNPRLMQLVDSVWPVAVKLILNRRSSEENRRNRGQARRSAEFAISRLNRSRALHITSLGSGFVSAGSTEHPLVYLMLCPHNATWQIGRMIDRVHYLAIFRLASIFEHAGIDNANDRMRRLISEIEQNKELSKIRSNFDSIRRIRRSVDDGVEGLHYRLEWSRYYLKVYRGLLAGTLFERVEGYQTYEEFVNRRIGLYFEAIDSAARRFQYVSRLLSERESQRTSEDSRDLLVGAEIVSIVPVAYYSHEIVKHINSWIVDSFQYQSSVSMNWVWLGLVSTYAGLVASRIYKRKTGHPLWRTLAASIWSKFTASPSHEAS